MGKDSLDYMIVSCERDYLSFKKPRFKYVYLNGMWILSKIKEILKSDVVVSGVFWLQGENDYANTDGYSDKLLKLRHQYVSDVMSITGQSSEPDFVIEESNYHGGNTVLDDCNINAHFKLNVEQSIAHAKAMQQDIALYISGPRYPLTNEIHMYPHAQRAHGEKMAQALISSIISGKSWSPLTYLSHKNEDDSVLIKFSVPKSPLQFRKPLNGMYEFSKDGCPKGFHFTGKSLTEDDVRIIGDDTVSINTSGKSGIISYVKEVRIGDLCDSDDFPNHFSDRYKDDNCMLNYCLPFEIEV
ncbi:TPA: hypothetical protein RMM48_002393 [Escherichia coli]|nr:hypothetical protein [Escherichia coli]